MQILDWPLLVSQATEDSTFKLFNKCFKQGNAPWNPGHGSSSPRLYRWETPKAELGEGLAFGAHGHLISPQRLEIQCNPSDSETFRRNQLSPVLTAHHSMASTFLCPSITSSSLYALHSPALETSGSLIPCMVPSLTHSCPLLVFFSHPEMLSLTFSKLFPKRYDHSFLGISPANLLYSAYI